MTRKQIEAAIKPEFMTKLKKLKIKTKFLNNIVNPKWNLNCWESEDPNAVLKQCLNDNTWIGFIAFAFLWDNTPEGSAFWCNISNK